jgi:indole-3-glycerol phosphate synthase
MPISLDQIVAATRLRVAKARAGSDSRELERRARGHRPRSFLRALEKKNSIAIIAELKKSSPSRGIIRADFNPENLAKELEMSGAAALSILTAEELLHGSLENLRIASAVTRLPCLRKDFIVDEFQVLEARANSADAILLIGASLSQTELIDLARRAAEFELDVLCEVHDETELKRALDAGCGMIGVNNRD